MLGQRMGGMKKPAGQATQPPELALSPRRPIGGGSASSRSSGHDA